jgi:hypothetical protein
MEIVGDTAFIADIFNGVFVLDISTPSYPVIIGSTITSANDIDVSGDYLYVCLNTGIRIYDISDLTNPISLTYYSIDGYTNHIKVVGNYAFLSIGSDGLLILNIQDPSHPFVVDQWESTSYVSCVEVVGNTLYLCNYAGVEIFDISDIYYPVAKGIVSDPAGKHYAKIVGHYLFVSQPNYGVAIIDVSDLMQPKKVGHFYNGGNYYGFDYYGSYLYLAALGNGLEIVTGSFFPLYTTTTKVEVPFAYLLFIIPIIIAPKLLKKRKRKLLN